MPAPGLVKGTSMYEPVTITPVFISAPAEVSSLIVSPTTVGAPAQVKVNLATRVSFGFAVTPATPFTRMVMAETVGLSVRSSTNRVPVTPPVGLPAALTAVTRNVESAVITIFVKLSAIVDPTAGAVTTFVFVRIEFLYILNSTVPLPAATSALNETVKDTPEAFGSMAGIEIAPNVT